MSERTAPPVGTAGSGGEDRAGRRSSGQVVDLAIELVVRDLKLRYRRSVLGLLWSQVTPLASVAVLTFVFTRVVPLDIPHYTAFVFVGILAWQWFHSGIVAGTESVVDAPDLVAQPLFPAAVLPAAAVLGQLAHFLLALPTLLAVVAVDTGGVEPTALALPLVATAQLAATLPLAIASSALNVRFRDVGHIVGVALVPLFYATPVFYERSTVPDRFDLLYDLNPMSHVVDGYRDAVLGGHWPDLGGLGLVALVGAVATVPALALMRRLAPGFAEEL